MQFYIENLSFLDKKFEDLRSAYQKAEKYVYYAPDLALVTLRAFSVQCVSHICPDNPKKKVNLYSVLNSEVFQKDVPLEIREKLNILRIEGNKAAHPEEYQFSIEQKKEVAIKCLKEAFEIACWLHKFLSKSSEIPPNLRLPEEKGDYVMYYNAIMENDVDAQYQIGMELKNRNDQHKQEVLESIKSEGKCSLLFQNDYVDSFYWFDKAAQRNHPGATYQLALAYADGRGVKKDPHKEEKYISKAASRGHDEAQYKLGKILFYDSELQEKKSYEEALHWLNESAAQDNPNALSFLVKVYSEGKGVTQNQEKAYEYACHEAKIGLEYHQYNLGSFYYCGIVVSKNIDKALKYYHNAADANNTKAQIALFTEYLKKDKNTAIDWLQRAAESITTTRGGGLKILHLEGAMLPKSLVE